VCHFTFGSYVAQGFGLHTHFKLQAPYFTKLPERLCLFSGSLYSSRSTISLNYIIVCFQILEMIHLYIYFKQENAKKIYIFSVAVFLRYLFCAKHSYGKITTKEECLFPEVTHIGKNSILGCFWELSYLKVTIRKC
jgi:hypothetical protein